ncbi:alpha/beta fold hydrolase [Streptomyces sp. VRA16 Mangrove soil]|uniref:alpha/beta fold hydrolase n=1 Tax=Streptomyces sp. VRA16 Mangrove soil TaxID=2817434 RepID=UPI001A9E1C0F|nr:alpha/beta hydrolase [Streptomyces sp. VRA16 Mangrove soil]MBO1330422.1 alpha/beta hydrolase [Streptomyces sp. VRA16 Mangrove soil]
MTDIAPAASGRALSRRKGVTIAALVAALVAVPASTMAAPGTSGTTATHTVKPTVVLVHGAFADSSSWNGVVARLEHEGYPVVGVANPLRDLAGDSAYLSSVLDTVPGPVVLVGHSYGGAVITDAAAGHANVKALVYVAAFAPDEGESALEITGGHPGSQLPSALVVRTFPGGQEASIDPASFRRVFAGDVSSREARLMAAAQRPVALAALGAPSSAPAWRSIPSWYLVAGADRAIPPAAEQAMARRAHAHTVTVPGASHAVAVSHPRAVADLIEAAARATD